MLFKTLKPIHRNKVTDVTPPKGLSPHDMGLVPTPNKSDPDSRSGLMAPVTDVTVLRRTPNHLSLADLGKSMSDAIIRVAKIYRPQILEHPTRAVDMEKTRLDAMPLTTVQSINEWADGWCVLIEGLESSVAIQSADHLGLMDAASEKGRDDRKVTLAE